MSDAIAVEFASGGDDLPPARDIRRWAAAALTPDRRDAELCIRLVDEAEGRALNQRFRGRDYATNVLSFPADLPPEVGGKLLGDLAICVGVVRREAAEQGKTLADHLAHLVIHGTLHLLGHDHENPAQAARMESREVELLATFGIGDPYGL